MKAGFAVTGTIETKNVKKYDAAKPGDVLILTKPLGTGIVLVDDFTGGKIATEHLLSTNHRTIGFLTGPEGSHSGQWRIQGYLEAVQKAGFPSTPSITRSCSPVAADGCDAAKDLLSSHPEITALLCYNDLVAVGALKACTDMGLRVPEDMAVVGFDDIPLAALVTPSLTTCHIPRYELGMTAVEMLLNHITHTDNDACEVILQPNLVIRASAPKAQ